MRRALIVFVSVLTVLGLSATAAQASPAPPTVQEEQARTLMVKVKPKYGKVPASFTTTEAAKRQDPPMGGCDWSDNRGEVTGYWVWTGLPNGCVSETDRMIACAAYTETGYLPPTYP